MQNMRMLFTAFVLFCLPFGFASATETPDLRKLPPQAASSLAQWAEVLETFDPAAAEAVRWRYLIRDLRQVTAQNNEDMTALAVLLKMHEVENRGYRPAKDYPAPEWMTPSTFVNTRTQLRDVDFAIATFFALRALGFDDVQLLLGINTPDNTSLIMVRVVTNTGIKYLQRGRTTFHLSLPSAFSARYMLDTEHMWLVRKNVDYHPPNG